MDIIPQVASSIQNVIIEKADQIARQFKFVERESKMGGSCFTQTVVFGWLSNPDATLEQLAQTAGTAGITITAQGLDQRFTEKAANLLEALLNAAVAEMITADPVAIPLLTRFNGVYIQDSSVITLPESLATKWAGCGGSGGGGKASVKIQVGLELSEGELAGPYLQDGRAQDRRSTLQSAPLPSGSLLIRDLGYWSLREMRTRSEAGGFWLSRVRSDTVIYDERDKRWDLLSFLRADGRDQVDVRVKLGKERLDARLLALRVPQEIAEKRRRQIRETARSRGQTPSKVALALAEWLIFTTNVPETLLTLREALALARSRWQIELLFKLWKSQGRIDTWRSKKPWRILCELYAKLLGMIIQHWILLVGCWQYTNRSLWKAAQTVQSYSLHLAAVLRSHQQLCAAIEIIQRCLTTGCRINTRRVKPNTYQILLDPSLLPLEGLA